MSNDKFQDICADQRWDEDKILEIMSEFITGEELDDQLVEFTKDWIEGENGRLYDAHQERLAGDFGGPVLDTRNKHDESL